LIVRATDAALHNSIFNLWEVNIHFGGAPIDFSEAVAITDGYVFLHNGRDAASIMEWSGPRMWQVHTGFAQSCRGKDAVREGKAMLAYMFDELNARLIWGQTPINNRRARMFNRLCGAKSDGFGVHHVSGPVEYFIVEHP
jgi:hypothetical protein